MTWYIFFLVAVLVLGASTLLWTAVGAGRFAVGLLRRNPSKHRQHRFRNQDVAVLIPAHNEEAVLYDSLVAAAALLPLSQIHVVSDGSTDTTVEIAERFGVQVYDLQPNRGKAGALAAAIDYFALDRLFKVMLLLDADTRLSPDYLATGLPLFDEPDVVSVAGRVRCQYDPPPRTWRGRFLVNYRSRLYAVTQLLVKYGQAARWINVVSIAPGFASMYRTDILKHIDITAEGLVIEDFNMTFEVHAKKLGRIAFQPNCAVAYTQDPDTWPDYIKQVQRWTLGYWQTVRRHKAHLGWFWVALWLQVIELLTTSVMLMFLPLLLGFTAYSQLLASTFGDPTLFGLVVTGTLDLRQAILGFLIPDLALTVFAAIALRRPSMLLLAPLFPVMRFVEAWICLRAIPPSAWRTNSTGRWTSPTRRKALPDNPVEQHIERTTKV